MIDLAESVKSVSAVRILLRRAFDFFHAGFVIGGLVPVGLEIFWSAWDFVFVTLSRLSFLGVSDRCKEVTSSLPRRAKPAHALKVLSCLISRPEVDLTSFIKYDGLVKQIVNILTSLIDCNQLGSSSSIRRTNACQAEIKRGALSLHSERSDEFQRCR